MSAVPELESSRVVDVKSIIAALQAGVEGERWYSVAEPARVYVGRKIHINWKIAHVVPGIASHLAWDVLVATGQTKAGPTGPSTMRTEFRKHVDLTGKIIKAIYRRLIASAGPITVTIGGQKTPKVPITVNLGAGGGAAAAVTA